jgi:mRNA interferase YafQ
MKWELLRSTAFVRAARRRLKRHPEQASDIFETLTQLTEDPYHPSLRTHKLTGALAGSWACSAGYDLRLVFKILKVSGKPVILLESVGTHDEVY